MDDERVAADLDRDPVDRGRRAGRAGERSDAGRQADLERPFDPDLLEAGDAEVAGRGASGRGECQRQCGGRERKVRMSRTFLQHC